MTDYKNELDVALSEYFTWRGEAIHEVNQTENYKRLLTKLEALLSKRELEAVERADHWWFQLMINKVGYEEARACKEAIEADRINQLGGQDE